MTLEPQQHPSIWTPPILWTTLGGVALIFLAAFESLAVTTVMPVVSEDLDGASLYAVAFAGTMAASIIGMIVVGIWCDRAAPLWPVTVSVLVFIAGGSDAGTGDCSGQAARASSSFMMVSNSTGVNRPRRTCRRRRW